MNKSLTYMFYNWETSSLKRFITGIFPNLHALSKLEYSLIYMFHPNWIIPQVTRTLNTNLSYFKTPSELMQKRPTTAVSAYWNYLPAETKMCISINSFKNKLKCFLTSLSKSTRIFHCQAKRDKNTNYNPALPYLNFSSIIRCTEQQALKPHNIYPPAGYILS